MPIHERILGDVFKGAALELMSLQLEDARYVRVATATAKARMTRMAKAIKALGEKRFRAFWIPQRLAVDLQMRLYVETVLFSMGKPWSELVSGFKPLRAPLGEW